MTRRSPAAYKLVVRAIIKPENTVDGRPKNFLTEAEMGNFLKAARKGRHSIRNFAMLLLTFRHGLRVSELINMRMADLDLDTGCLCAVLKAASQPANLWREMKFAPYALGYGSESKRRAAIRRWYFCRSAAR